MKPEQKAYIEKFLEKMHVTMLRKGADYAGDEDTLKNFKSLEQFNYDTGAGMLYRISDKFSRIAVLMKDGKEPMNESVQDTLLDLACYSVLLSLYLKEKHETEEIKEI